MPTRKLDKAEWRPFLDGISKLLEAKEVEIEVASLSLPRCSGVYWPCTRSGPLGDQVQAKWLPLHGVTYDSKDDMVEVALEGLDHMIPRPREIYAQEGTAGLASLEVVDSTGAKQIVKFRDQLLLASSR
jgi:hypothetical protein